ncbi:ABC transporter substrate-binding protein [Pelagibacterium lentulum]|uniref:Sugar ABC transporter substrate-binding protein n=1 Tax=Pelagibacterium lentulum TaxID=2029865 RepID=A0A916RBU5_9HYPH|nr:extracellular solute-binding protein [Pelagibacterium lentulum]GGA50091.1 sugar ABC transporter substrate-binding protein [Pelagibacterium lentulum]
MKDTKVPSVAIGPVIATSLLALALATMPMGAIAQDNDLQGDIRFSWWGGQVRNDKTDRIIQLFEAANPGVSISRETADFVPYWERLTIQSAGNNQPCAITMQSRWLATYARPDILMPLDDLVADGTLDVTGIPDAVMDSSRGADGNLYMIPHGVFYFALMYNEQMLENGIAAGVEPMEWPYTWEEYAEHLRAIQATLPDGAVATHNMGREPDAFIPWVQSHGEKVFEGSEVAFSQEIAVAWFEYWEELRREGVTESPEEMISENSALVEESNLANGRGYATNRPPNQLGSVQTVTNTVNPGATINTRPYPVGPDGTVGMDLGTNGIAIGANCAAEQIPATAAWINFWTQNPEAAGIYQSDNGVVSIPELANAQAADPATQPTQVRLIELYNEVVPTANPVFWPAGGYQAMTDVLNRSYDAVAFEQLTPEQGAEQLISELQQQLSQAAR